MPWIYKEDDLDRAAAKRGLVPIARAMAALGLSSEASLYRRLHDGRLKGEKFGPRTYVDVTSLEELRQVYNYDPRRARLAEAMENHDPLTARAIREELAYEDRAAAAGAAPPSSAEPQPNDTLDSLIRRFGGGR
jgi:hypothetical protein